MDTRYDVISNRWSSHFWLKMHVFQLFSGIKEKLRDKMMQSNYLCDVLLVKHKKLLTVTVFTWFLVLEKMQDGYHVWWHHRPLAVPPRIKYTSYCRELRSKAFHWRQRRNKWRIHQPQPPPPPPRLIVPRWGCMTLRVRPRVKPAYNSEWKEIGYGLVDNLRHLLQFPHSWGRGFHLTI